MTAEDFFNGAGEQLASLHIREALELYRVAESTGYNSDPCAAGRWICYMLTGDFEFAWRESDAIALRGQPDPHRFWDGQPFAGRRVLLRCLHGLGDTLQFVRYARLVRQQARSLTIEAQPELKTLLREAEMADYVMTWGEPEPPWDQQVEVMELPKIFRTTLQSIPDEVPYIHLPGESPVTENQFKREMLVGIVWASGRYNPARSIPVELFAKLFGVPDVSFISLQVGPEGDEVQPWAKQVKVPASELTGIFETARTLKCLDLVITVDTMTAHLAGAMGRPVWTLLPYACDWRWMLERRDSPWYPTMRLFRQQRPDSWAEVLQEVQRELTILAGSICGSHHQPVRDSAALPLPVP